MRNRFPTADPNRTGLDYLNSIDVKIKQERPKSEYVEKALKITQQKTSSLDKNRVESNDAPSKYALSPGDRLSSMDEYERSRTRCSGGLNVSKKALLGMLGSKKFEKKQVVSERESSREEALEALDLAGGNLNVASSRLGISKSSLKRRIQPSSGSPASYDETNPTGISRRYLEKNFESWTVHDFDARTKQACLAIRSPSGTVTLSVDIPRQY